ncbi:MAG: DNA replication/repair protein RecF [Pseudohongiella sp.]|nr:DNA replication/repair protein RecF [Pseudohongiella sp.]
MAIISRLKVDNFRNLQNVDLELNPRFNIFFGDNGSGKTSLLEAIHVLSVGKSFRTSKVEPLLAETATEFFLYSELDTGDRIGLQRASSSHPTLRLNTNPQSSWKEVATLLPVQVINSDVFLLVDGGASVRRRFLDWALFHVEHSYLICWRNYRKIIQQRNALLKQSPTDLLAQLKVWDSELSKVGEEINRHRKVLISEYVPFLMSTLSEFFPGTLNGLEIQYKKGWLPGIDLAQALSESKGKDIKYRATSCGPHRAEILITSKGSHIAETFSRGQIKLVACALKISMSKYMENKKLCQGNQSYSTVFLIDDLASELDQTSCASVLKALKENKDQCIFTSISQEAFSFLAELTGTSGKFHVEHGKIYAVKPAV